MMDFKDWKKIREDKQGVEMMHPKGHSMMILYKGVPAIQREALKRLPLHDGGEISGVHKSDYDAPAREIKNKYQKSNAGESKVGSHVRKFNESKAFQKDLSREEAIDAHHQVLGELTSQPKPKIQGLADGGEVSDQASSDDSDDSNKSTPPVTVNVNSGPVPQQQSTAANQASTPVEVQQPKINPINPSVLLPNGSMSAPGAAETAQQALTGQAAIDASKAQAMVPVEQARLQAERDQAQRDQDNINALRTHADNLAQNLKDVDPDAYRKNMSAPGKVSTALGLFLGGFSVPFGGQNFAADFLNRQIDRDIDAQKANQEKQKTIFGAYNTLYGNQDLASNMARVSMKDIYLDQASQIAAKLGTPQAMVNLQKLRSDMAISQNKNIRDAAVNLNSLPNNPSGGMRQTQDQPQAPNKEDQSSKQNGIENVGFKILKPGAESRISELLNPQYHPEIGESDRARIASQMTQASQAEKALQRLDNEKIFESLVLDTRQGGPVNRVLRNVGPHAFGAVGAGIGAALKHPVVGGAIGEGIGHMIPSTEINRKFETDQQKMAGLISSALSGRGDTFVREAVNKFTPEYGDSTETLKTKLRGLKEYIIDHTETDALKRHGITYK